MLRLDDVAQSYADSFHHLRLDGEDEDIGVASGGFVVGARDDGEIAGECIAKFSVGF